MAAKKKSGKSRSIRKKRANQRTVIIVLAVTLLFAAVIGVTVLIKRREARELEAEKARLEERYAELQSLASEIAEERGRELTPSEIEALARDRFGLVYPNEIVFIPKDQ